MSQIIHSERYFCRGEVMGMSDLIDTTEMYLKVVFELEEQRQPALRARLAERLEQAMPSVSQTVSRLERDGLLRLGDERIVELTDEGREPPAGVAVGLEPRLGEPLWQSVDPVADIEHLGDPRHAVER